MRDSREHPEALTPGERYKVRIKLDDIGYRVPKDHRLRLSFSSAYFPLLWPPKEKARLTLFTKDASLWVPVHDGPLLTADPFPPPESARPIRLTELRAADSTWHVEEDAASGQVTTIFAVDSGKHRFEDHGLVAGESSREEYSVAPNDPSSAMADLTWTYEVARGDVEVRVESHCRLTGNEERFSSRPSRRRSRTEPKSTTAPGAARSRAAGCESNRRQAPFAQASADPLQVAKLTIVPDDRLGSFPGLGPPRCSGQPRVSALVESRYRAFFRVALLE